MSQLSQSPPPSYHTHEDSDPDDVTEYQRSASPSESYRDDVAEDREPVFPSERSDEIKIIVGLVGCLQESGLRMG